MRYAIVLCVALLCGCDDELKQAFYSNGEPWEPVVPLDPGRVAPAQMDARAWSRFVSESGIQADADVKTFTPTWLFFSSAPTGTMNYLDFGALVAIWTDTVKLGTSNDVFMLWDAGSIPREIRPTSSRVVNADVMDNTVNNLKGAVVIGTDGSATFTITQVVGVQLADVGNNFTPANQKGLPAGWLVLYSR